MCTDNCAQPPTRRTQVRYLFAFYLFQFKLNSPVYFVECAQHMCDIYGIVHHTNGVNVTFTMQTAQSIGVTVFLSLKKSAGRGSTFDPTATPNFNYKSRLILIGNVERSSLSSFTGTRMSILFFEIGLQRKSIITLISAFVNSEIAPNGNICFPGKLKLLKISAHIQIRSPNC